MHFANKAKPKMLNTILFHLYDILEKEKQICNTDQWLPEDGEQSKFKQTAQRN